VEFLYDPTSGRFFFLEMNTRLQVEHPVTELVHGVDLVAVQLAVAEGRAVPEAAAGSGHAIEARIYAEDPERDYAPQSGLLTELVFPEAPGLRVDAGYAAGSRVTTYYDAMLAKVVAHAPTREQAARLLADALARARIHGVRTNRDQLVALLRAPSFLTGDVSTAFLDEHPPVSTPAPGDHAVAAALALAEHDRTTRTVQQRVPVAWRNVVSQPQVTRFIAETSAPRAGMGVDHEGEAIAVEWWGGRDGYVVPGLVVRAAGPTAVTVERAGVATTYQVAIRGDRLDVDGVGGHLALRVLPRFAEPEKAVATGSLLAPMPGTVVGVEVEKGQQVTVGQPVLVLEAMKMQHTVAAAGPGIVVRLDVVPGDQVAAGQVLAVVEESLAEEAE
jgi:propionyl-CoA carboxylase alpha chain